MRPSPNIPIGTRKKMDADEPSPLVIRPSAEK